MKKDIKLSSKQMLLDIRALNSIAARLLGGGKPYEHLLKVLLDMNYYYDDEAELPFLKALAKMTSLSYGKIRIQLRQIYNDLVFDEAQEPLIKNHKTTVVFELKHRGRYAHFKVENLAFIPRIGESVNIPFFKAYLDNQMFFVENIYHYFNDREHEIHIGLKAGTDNLYWHIRKDKAQEEMEVGLLEFFHLNDCQLKDRLGVGKGRPARGLV